MVHTNTMIINVFTNKIEKNLKSQDADDVRNCNKRPWNSIGKDCILFRNDSFQTSFGQLVYHHEWTKTARLRIRIQVLVSRWFRKLGITQPITSSQVYIWMQTSCLSWIALAPFFEIFLAKQTNSCKLGIAKHMTSFQVCVRVHFVLFIMVL